MSMLPNSNATQKQNWKIEFFEGDDYESNQQIDVDTQIATYIQDFNKKFYFSTHTHTYILAI